MTLSQQVCSLDLAKRLKELDVPQKSLFFHHEYKGVGEKRRHFTITQNPNIPSYPNPDAVEYENVYSAFTSAELGEILAKALEQLQGKKIIDPRGHFKRAWHKITRFEDEANNRAKMLIYLLEQKIITI